MIVELLALSEEEVGEEVVLEDREDGPDALRVFLSLARGPRLRRARRTRGRRRPPAVPAVRQPARRRGAHLSAAERLPPRRAWLSPSPPRTHRCRSTPRSREVLERRGDHRHRPAHRRLERDPAGRRRRWTASAVAVHLQAGPRRAAAVGLPGRHPGRAGARRLPGLRRRRLGLRAADRRSGTGRSGRAWCSGGSTTPTRTEMVDLVPVDASPGRLAAGAARGRRGRRGRRRRARRRPGAGRARRVRPGRQQRRPQGLARPADSRTAGCWASTTACASTRDDKLRTILWGWAGKPLPDAVVDSIARLIRARTGPRPENSPTSSRPPRSLHCAVGSAILVDRRCSRSRRASHPDSVAAAVTDLPALVVRHRPSRPDTREDAVTGPEERSLPATATAAIGGITRAASRALGSALLDLTAGIARIGEVARAVGSGQSIPPAVLRVRVADPPRRDRNAAHERRRRSARACRSERALLHGAGIRIAGAGG